ncbi:Predicted secreted protein [Tistlia consotensis]|uniref:Predicted secreted protein n=1 Tax=Tistlia consotensis USBA 355 TaxID=560819 RepID=A0A1Y6BS52_9PROT|nr:DUF1467 family protein [Tistlia consotensis]SMF25201.1 Predicted secreted protein [Tistlia consotensis USBA 355]SNR59847.1 Predicted secreted protein [Tistlia consotensis]
MTWFESIVVYFLVWWLALFVVLPFGARPSAAPEEGHEPGAPDKPRLWTKVLATSLLAAVIWGAVYLVVDSGLISFRSMVEHATY